MISTILLYNTFTIVRVLNIISYIFLIFYFNLINFARATILTIVLIIGSFVFLLIRVCTNRYFIGEYILSILCFVFNCIEHSSNIDIIIPYSISCFDLICTIITECLFSKIYMRIHLQSPSYFFSRPTTPIRSNQVAPQPPQSDYIEINISEYTCEKHTLKDEENSIEELEECENCICMICLSSMNGEIVGNNNCKHYFHYKCISNYIIKGQLTKFNCPVCRN